MAVNVDVVGCNAGAIKKLRNGESPTLSTINERSTDDNLPTISIGNFNDFDDFGDDRAEPTEKKTQAVQLKVFFVPGSVGITIARSGLVLTVDEQKQAYDLGIQIGMYFLTVEGEPYSVSRYRAARAGTGSYEVTFVQAAASSGSECEESDTDSDLDIDYEAVGFLRAASGQELSQQSGQDASMRRWERSQTC